MREPEPEHIIELITEAERNLEELFAVPLVITDANGSPSECAPPVRHGSSSLGR
jgi:hypothetical protein